MDNQLPCRQGVTGSIPGFSIKPLLVEPSSVPVIKYKYKPLILQAQYWLLPLEKPQKGFFKTAVRF